MLSSNRSYRIRIFDISLVLFAICLHCNAAILISAIEGNGLEFNPPSEWQAIQSGNATGKKTTKLGTNVTFTFQGKGFSNAYVQPIYDLTPVSYTQLPLLQSTQIGHNSKQMYQPQ